MKPNSGILSKFWVGRLLEPSFELYEPKFQKNWSMHLEAMAILAKLFPFSDKAMRNGVFSVLNVDKNIVESLVVTNWGIFYSF